MGDFLSDIGNAFGAVVQGVEHEVENLAGNVMGGMTGGAGQTHGASPVGGGSPADMLSNFDIGGFLSGGLNGIAGGLVGQFGGDAFGILGNIFASPTDAGASVAGYAHTGSFTGSASGSVSASVNGSGQPPPGHAATAASNASISPEFASQMASSVQTLMDNFEMCSKDGKITKQSLQQALSNPDASDELKKSIKFFLKDSNLNGLLDVMGKPPSADYDRLTKLENNWSSLAPDAGGADVPAAAGDSGGASQAKAKLDAMAQVGINPNAEKIANEMKKKAATDAGAGDTTPSGDAGGTPDITTEAKKSTSTGEFGPAMDGIDKQIANMEKQINEHPENATQLEGKLKDLYMQKQAIIELEQELFTMKSEIQKAFHDMSMTAIRNING